MYQAIQRLQILFPAKEKKKKGKSAKLDNENLVQFHLWDAVAESASDRGG